jgi:hypothetical protein
MLSEMPENDLATVGHTLGFGETIDTHHSVAWNASASDTNGSGFTNHRVFAQNPSVSGAATAVEFVSSARRYHHNTRESNYWNFK